MLKKVVQIVRSDFFSPCLFIQPYRRRTDSEFVSTQTKNRDYCLLESDIYTNEVLLINWIFESAYVDIK